MSSKTNYKLYILVLYVAYWIWPAIIITICYVAIIVTFKRSSTSLKIVEEEQQQQQQQAIPSSDRDKSTKSRRVDLTGASSPLSVCSANFNFDTDKRRCDFKLPQRRLEDVSRFNSLMWSFKQQRKKRFGGPISPLTRPVLLRQLECCKQNEMGITASRFGADSSAELDERQNVASSCLKLASEQQQPPLPVNMVDEKREKDDTRRAAASVPTTNSNCLVGQTEAKPASTKSTIMSTPQCNVAQVACQQESSEVARTAEVGANNLKHFIKVTAVGLNEPPTQQAPISQRLVNNVVTNRRFKIIARSQTSHELRVRNRASRLSDASAGYNLYDMSGRLHSKDSLLRRHGSKIRSKISSFVASRGHEVTSSSKRVQTPTAASSSCHIGASSSHLSRTSLQIRLAKTSFYLILLWFISWTPIATLAMINSVFKCHQRTSALAVFTANTMTKLGPAFDVFIYGISHPKIKSKFKQIIKWLLIIGSNQASTKRTFEQSKRISMKSNNKHRGLTEAPSRLPH